ncbi:hypothetical protein B296_00002333 [Ensete ventricosum]|uniref:Protein kinase domain-containing protein n=1 Tax=Ensete ventricosum TaxID=4639 RepID=A0A427A612_ENSVE|nr:hypothetical protein B296_00002333 [Ensete ventricosum]
MEGEYRRDQSTALLIIVVVAVLSLVSLTLAFSYYCYISNKVAKHLESLSKSPKEERENAAPLSGSRSGEEPPVVVSERRVQVFTYKQLHSATAGFGKGNVVSHGSSGAVYRGVLADGREVAVKIMDRPGMQGEEEFKLEVSRCYYLFFLNLYSTCL